MGQCKVAQTPINSVNANAKYKRIFVFDIIMKGYKCGTHRDRPFIANSNKRTFLFLMI